MVDAQPSFSVPSQQNYGIVLVTTPSQAEAESIASILIEEKMAAGISMMPVHSIYIWKGAVHQKEEWQLIIKTKLDKFAELETRVKSIHSYEVPEIIALPIVNGHAPYLQWLDESI